MSDPADRDITTNALFEEILETLQREGANQTPVHYSYWIEFDAGGETFHPYQLLSIDVRKNYNQTFTDETVITVKMPEYYYERLLYPNRENFTVTIFRQRHGVGKDTDSNAQAADSKEFRARVEQYSQDPEDLRAENNIEFFRYRGVLMDKRNKMFESSRASDTSGEDLSKEEPQTYHILLINPAVEKLLPRIFSSLYRENLRGEYINEVIRSSGIYRNTTVEDLLRGILTDVSADVSSEVDEEFEIAGVDIIEPDNQTEYDHLIIPHDIRIIELPRYVHEHCGGIYSHGLGYYLQYCPAHIADEPEAETMQWSEDRQQGKWFWFIYPEYATARFDEVEDNLTIINVPENRFEGIERTYFVQHTSSLYKKVVALSTGDVLHEDQSDTLEFNRGTGSRWVKGDLFEHFAESIDPSETGWEVEIDSSENIDQFLGYQRKSGENYIPLRPRRITSNPYYMHSHIASRQGTIVRFHWQNGDPELIYPGMPVRLYHMFDNDLDEYEGVVIGCDTDAFLKSQDPTETRMQTDVLLTLFVDRPEKRDAEWFQGSLLDLVGGEVLTDQ